MSGCRGCSGIFLYLNMHRNLYLIGLLQLFLMISVSGQEESKRSIHSVSASINFKYNDTDKLSGGGIQYQLWSKITRQFGWHLAVEYLNHDGEIMSAFPVTIGMHYKVHDFGALNFAVFGSSGVSGEVGNDFGSFAAIGEAGFALLPEEGRNIVVELSYVQSWMFHPSHYSYAKLALGYAF